MTNKLRLPACAVLFAFLSGGLAQAQTFTQGNLTFTVLDAAAKTVSVASATPTIQEAVIPASVEEGGETYTVTEFAANAFANCEQLASVYVPASITVANTKAFYYCSALEQGTLTVEDPAAFAMMLKAAPNASPLYYAGKMYCNGELVTEVTYPEGIEDVPDYSLYYGAGITTVNLPSSVKSLGLSAFGNMTDLTSLALPGGLVHIGKNAFQNSGITSLYIPDSVTTLDDSAFGNMKQLQEIRLPEGLQAIPVQGFYFDGALASLNIPESVTAINKQALLQSGIVKLVIPDGVVEIGEQACNRMDALTEVTIGSGVTTIGKKGFYNTKAANCHMAKVTCRGTVPPELTPTNSSYDNFRNETYETAVLWVPDGCTAAYQAAEGWKLFQNIEEFDPDAAGKSVEADGILYTVTSGSEFTAEASAASTAITEAPILSDVTIDGHTYTVTSIGSFEDCGSLLSITIPSTVAAIGYGAFSGTTSLAQVNVESLGSWLGVELAADNASPLAYAGTLTVGGTPLTEIVIPEGTQSINDYAFCGAFKIESVSFPEGLISIGEEAFYGCSSLKTATFADQTAVKAGVRAFSQCGFETLELEAFAPGSGAQIFADCPELVSVTFQEGVTSVLPVMFARCSSLATVSLPSTLTKIGKASFRATAVAAVDLPASVQTIGEEAYAECPAITSVKIGNEVASVGAMAFWSEEPQHVTTVTVQAFQPPVCDMDAPHGIFADNVYADATLIVPKASASLYEVTPGWSGFAMTVGSDFSDVEERVFTEGDFTYTVMQPGVNEVEVKGASVSLSAARLPQQVVNSHNGMLYSVTAIAEEGFKNCKALATVEIPASVTRSGRDAFGGCTALERVVSAGLESWLGIEFADSAANPVWFAGNLAFGHADVVFNALDLIGKDIPVGDYAFCGLRHLESVALPDGQLVGRKAFSDCPALATVSFGPSELALGEEAFARCGIVSLVLPANAVVGQGCFRENESLVSAVLPENMETTPEALFLRCTALNEITWPLNLKFLSMSTVNYTGFKKLELPETLETVDAYACTNNGELTAVTLGPNVTEIGAYAFFMLSTPKIKAVRCYAEVPPEASVTEWGVGYWFPEKTYASANLLVPRESIEAYKAAPYWKDFLTVKALEGDSSAADLEADAEETLYYDLLGNCVPADARGVVIERKGGAVCKRLR